MKTQVNLFTILLTAILPACNVETPEEKFQRETNQKPILTRHEIDSVLNDFETIAYEDLSPTYKDSTDPEKKFRKKLAKTKYLIVRGVDVYKYVVGKTPIKNFLCPDQYYTSNEKNLTANKAQYWLIDRSLIYLIHEFMMTLEARGLNKYGFYVRESHRHPRYNVARGGASQSQHIYGKAADLVIEDINFDGSITDQDKDLCLEILEELVGNKGGMGLYPGTMVIHIDTRGHRARWNFH